MCFPTEQKAAALYSITQILFNQYLSMTRRIIPFLITLTIGMSAKAQYAGNTHPRVQPDTTGQPANTTTPASSGQRAVSGKTGKTAKTAQSGAPAKVRAAIHVLSRPQKNSILLRWAVNTPGAWKISNQYGFRIERYTVIRNNNMLATPELTILSPRPILPRPLNEWETIAKSNNYAAVMAQAIYGKDFELSGGDDKGLAKMINRSNELDQRFIMSLYAADNSFEAACWAGWGWVDSTAKWNEKYLYRILSAVPAAILSIDSASTYVGIGSFKPLPVPGGIGTVFGDRSVMLSWDYNTLKAYYHSYIVEKSEDGGKTFHALSDLPVTNLNNKENHPSNRMYFIDSLKDNQTSNQYRIIGISPFGEHGPPSPIVEGKGKTFLAFVPHIRKGSVDEKGRMDLEWEFETAGNPLIKGFAVRQSVSADGGYKTIVDSIPAGLRKWSIPRAVQLNTGNYFTITALAKSGEGRTSFPVLIQPVDSVPPAVPVGLEGKIDSNGMVLLSWKPNTESDLLGYRIFRANNRGEELSVLTDSVYFRTTYRERVSLKTLNNKLYYAVAALDKRYNQSPATAIIEIKKPDRIPPASPVLTSYKVLDNKVVLNWISSTDEDVAAHYLYRKEGKGDADDPSGRDQAGNPSGRGRTGNLLRDSLSKWQLIATFTDTAIHAYTDTKTVGNSTYSYRITAKDSSGLESPAIMPLTIVTPPDPSEMTIRSLNSYIDRDHRYIEISWTDDLQHVGEYQVYRGVNGKAVSLWKIVTAGERKRIADDAVNVNSTYEYGIRALIKGGATGPYKAIQVKY